MMTELYDALIRGETNPPERIYGWLDSQLSIARHYGGMKYEGHDYIIAENEPEQPLVRVDVLRREAQEAKESRKAVKQFAALKSAKSQGELL